jgi:hypothetical protein
MRYFLAPLALAAFALGTFGGTEPAAAHKPRAPTALAAGKLPRTPPPPGTLKEIGPKPGPGTARKLATPPGHADLIRLGKRPAFDRARRTVHAIDGKRQVLTPASLRGVKGVRDLYTGQHALGRFETESASRLLRPGTHHLTLARAGGQWRVYAAREGGTRVHQATKVTVRYLKGATAAPANEVRKGSFLFVMYFWVFDPWWGPVLVQVIAYFP